MQPYNYNIDVQSPIDSALKGYQAGLAITQQQQVQEQQQRALEMQQRMQQDMAALAANKNPTAQDYAGMMTRYPQLSEHFKRSWDVLDSAQQKSKLQDATAVFSALQNSPEVAGTLLDAQATALENSGDKRGSQAAKALAELAREQPGLARALAGTQLAAIMGIKDFAPALASIGGEQRAAAKAPAELRTAEAGADKARADATVAQAQAGVAVPAAQAAVDATQAGTRNIDSQIVDRREQRRIERDRLDTETSLKLDELNQKAATVPEDARKLANTAYQGAVQKIGQADKSADLADRIDARLRLPGGLASRGWSGTLRALGLEGEDQALQQEFSRLRNANIMANLPSAFNQNFSNSDRSFVEKGIPDESADPKYIAGFLRTMDKVLRAEAAAERATGAWVSSVHSLGDAPRDVIVDGVRVPKGTSFADFAKMTVDRTKAQTRQGDVLRRYERYAK